MQDHWKFGLIIFIVFAGMFTFSVLPEKSPDFHVQAARSF